MPSSDTLSAFERLPLPDCPRCGNEALDRESDEPGAFVWCEQCPFTGFLFGPGVVETLD